MIRMALALARFSRSLFRRNPRRPRLSRSLGETSYPSTQGGGRASTSGDRVSYINTNSGASPLPCVPGGVLSN